MKINQQMTNCLFLVKTNDNSANSDWNDLICEFEH